MNLLLSLKSLYTFFHDFIHEHSPGTGVHNPLGMKFLCQQEHLVTSVICCKFKKKSLQSLILYNCFIYLILYIAPGQGKTAPRGRSFDVNKKILSLRSFVTSFKTMHLKSDFIQLFS